MIAIYSLCCATAFKNNFRFKFSCSNNISFKELYG